MEKHFTIEAHYGRANLKAAVRSSEVEEVVAHWTDQLAKVETDDLRAATRSLVVDSLLKDKHHGNVDEASIVSSALVWLTSQAQWDLASCRL
jgi:hypothetical protein